MLPSNQGFNPGNFSGVKVDYRLIEKKELARFERSKKFAKEGESLWVNERLLFRIIKGEIRSNFFCLQHCNFSLLDLTFGGYSMFGKKDDAD